MTSQHPDIMAEITKQQATKPSRWGSFILILVVSLVLFIGSMGIMQHDGATSGFDWMSLTLLVAVLLFHEAGHYVAMRWSGYQNLKMFFIPFLGAAVSGHSYQVAGWKKTVVSLAGPLPGIFLGCVLTVVGLLINQPELLKAALLLLVLNGLNLLPILPFDGGWVAHQLLFSRHPSLDLIFRIIAVAGLLGLSILMHAKVMMFVAIFVAIGIPLAFRQARITADLRRADHRIALDAGPLLTPEVADPIIARVVAAHPKGIPPRLAAQHTIAIVDALSVQPQGWGISCVFLGLHAGSLLLAVIFSVLAGVGMHGGIPTLRKAFTNGLHHRGAGQIQPASETLHRVASTTVTPEPALPSEQIPMRVLVATCTQHAAAVSLARELKSALPAGSTCLVFGDSLLVSLPIADQQTFERIMRTVTAQDPAAFVATPTEPVELHLVAQQDGPAAAVTASAIRLYLSTPDPSLLIPPWVPHDLRSRAQQDLDTQNRALCQPLLNGLQAGRRSPRGRELFAAIRDAEKRGDLVAANALRADLQRTCREGYAAVLEQLALANPTSAPLIDACRPLIDHLDKRDFNGFYNATATPFLGPLADGDEGRYCASYGRCPESVTGLELTIAVVDPQQALPVVITWLEAQGCRDLQYRLQPVSDDVDEPGLKPLVPPAPAESDKKAENF